MSPKPAQAAPRVRQVRRPLDGILLLDKATGQSSNHALQSARWLYRAEKAGHTGTLDPLATGLLPVCFGEATKFSAELLDADKRYTATLQLGVTTDTADAEGQELQRRPVAVGVSEIESVLPAFLGDIEQIPPMHSALKRDGRPLYEYARAGVVLEREARRVTIHSLKMLDWSPEAVILDVHCSKGTYVRTLAADIGEKLGCGAHLSALRRTAIGRLSIEEAKSLVELEQFDEQGRDGILLPVDALLSNLLLAALDLTDMSRFCHGQAVRWVAEPGQRLKVYGPDARFLGTGRQTPDGWLQPQRLVAEQR